MPNRLKLGNSMGSVGAGSEGFQVINSFLSDGTDEKFNLNTQADWSDYTNGSSKAFSIPFAIRKTRNGSVEAIVQQWGASNPVRSMALYFFNDKLYFQTKNEADANASANTTATFTNILDFYVGMLVYDSSQSLGSRVKIFMNGTDEALDADTTDETLNTVTRTFEITPSSALYINQVGLINKACTFAEYTTWYNNGKPLNLRDTFGSDVKDWFNADNSGDTAQFTITDTVSDGWMSFNYEDADKVLINPY